MTANQEHLAPHQGHPETYYVVTWRDHGQARGPREFLSWSAANEFCDDLGSATHVQIETKNRVWMGGGD